MTKRKVTYEQGMALAYGQSIARSNQRRRVAAKQQQEREDRERAAERAKQEQHELDMRFGFELGQTVTGRERTFGGTKTGVVVEGPRSERGTGVFIVDADGNEWLLGRYSVELVKDLVRTRVYRLGQNFVDDHWARDLPEDQTAVSRKVAQGKRTYDVELDTVGYEELLSDARYYATEMMGAGFYDGGNLCRSAARVVAALEKAGAPA